MSTKEIGITNTNDKYFSAGMYVAGIVPIFPLSNIAIPLAIWLFKKDSSTFINKHGKNVINFQITISLIFLSLMLLGAATFFLLFTIPVFTLLGSLLYIAEVILFVIAGVKALKDDFYELPFKYKFIK